MTTRNADLNGLDTGQPNDDAANEALSMTQEAADAEAAQPIAKGQKKRSFADTPLAQARRDNTRLLMKQNNVNGSTLNKALGTSTTFVTQTVGPNPIMPISNDRARQIEAFFKVQPGYLDTDHSVAQPAPPQRCAASPTTALPDNTQPHFRERKHVGNRHRSGVDRSARGRTPTTDADKDHRVDRGQRA